MSEELIPTNRQEKIMSDTIRALNGDDVADALVPGWDDEYFLDNILKAAQGEDPQYNLEPRWHHQKFYKAIAEAIAKSGGGGSNWELLASKEFAVTTSSTSATPVGTVDLTGKLDTYTKNDIIVVHVRDKAGKRDGYFYGTDVFFLNDYLANNKFSPVSTRSIACIRIVDGEYMLAINAYGVYGGTLEHRAKKDVIVEARYHGTYSKTIDGTYKVDVYKLTLPEGMTLFE